MLKHRVLSAVVLLPAAILIIYAGGWIFVLTAALAALLMLYEWNMVSTGRGHSLALYGQTCAIWLALGLAASGRTADAWIVVGGAGLLLALHGRWFKSRAAWPCLGFFYIGIPMVALVWLRRQDIGWVPVMWMFAVVWATDIGGYVFGRLIGGPRLVPRISPKKTWAGLLGGMILAATVSAMLGRFLPLIDPLSTLIPAAAALAIWEQIGDIGESAFKRHFDVKDSGALIPGHGGILDRLDGLLFVIPVVALVVWQTGGVFLERG